MSVQVQLVFSSIEARPEAVHTDVVFLYSDGRRVVFAAGPNGNYLAVGLNEFAPGQVFVNQDTSKHVVTSILGTVTDATAAGMIGSLIPLANDITNANYAYVPYSINPLGLLPGVNIVQNSNNAAWIACSYLGFECPAPIDPRYGNPVLAPGFGQPLPNLDRAYLRNFSPTYNSDGSYTQNFGGVQYTYNLPNGWSRQQQASGERYEWRYANQGTQQFEAVRLDAGGGKVYEISQRTFPSGYTESVEISFANGIQTSTSDISFSGTPSLYGSGRGADYVQVVTTSSAVIEFKLNADGDVVPSRVFKINGHDVPLDRQEDVAASLMTSSEYVTPDRLATPSTELIQILNAYDPIAPQNQTSGAIDNDVTVLTHTTDVVSDEQTRDITSALNTQGQVAGSGDWSIVLAENTANVDSSYYGGTVSDTSSDGYRPGNNNISGTGSQTVNIGDAAADLVATLADYMTSGGHSGTNVIPEIAYAGADLTNLGYNTPLIPADPLVLDLNGDGIQLKSYADSNTYFDIDNDGGGAGGHTTKEHTGWIAANTTNGPGANSDGIVVHDLNGDGQINGIKETLSEYYNGNAGIGAEAGVKTFSDGFAALKSLDSNSDNVFNNQDAAWSSLRVWVDDDANGVSFKDTNANGIKDAGEASELKTFAELGITSINLATTSQSGLVNNGNEVLSSSAFVQNGQTNAAQAVRFIANPNGASFSQTATNGVAGATITTQGNAGDADVRTYVSANTNSAVGEILGTASLNVANIYAGVGDDVLTGDTGANWLSGGVGSDTFNAGAGDDVLLIDSSDHQNNIHAGSGNDVVQVVGAEGVTFNMAQAEAEVFVGGEGNDIIIGGGRSTVFVRGGAGDDVIIGGAADDVLSGEDGADVIDGGAGNDLIRGHRGQDQLLGGQGDDVLDGGLEDDTLSGGAGNDVLIGGRGDDKLNGGDGIDVAQYSGSYADYRITRIKDAASGGTVFRVVDTRTGQDGADTLTNIEKLSFADVSRVDLTLAAPLPAKDILSVNSSGQALSRTAAHLLSKLQLLANDRDWDSATSQLTITEVLEAKGGTVTLTAQGDVLFTPDASYTGVMSFKYKVQDAQGNYTQVTSPTGQTEAMKAAVYLQTSDLPTDPLAVEQWYLTDTNVIAAWGTAAEQAAGKGYSGKGIKIGQFEPGGPFSTGPEVFDYRHPDLAPNADKAWLNTLDANGNNNTPQVFSNHATMVAGVMVAARNGEGGVGVAYNASLAGHYIQGEGLEVSQLNQEITNALAKFKNYDVVNNSWGPTANFQLNVTPVGLLQTGMLDAIQNGRSGLGTAIVMAGGNDREHGANTNYNALTANRAVITVGSINAPGDLGTLQMGSKPFSNPGSSILVSAPGSNIDSTSRELIADNGSTFGSDYNTSQGTSFAAPIISGIIALMLEANPGLGYRDIQTILAMSATQFTDPNGTDWTYNTAKNWNGGGMHASHDYGFGKVDARAAVRLAETWYDISTFANEQNKTASSGTLNAAIPDGAGVLTRTLTMAAGLEVETAQVTLELSHQRWGDLIIKLISPMGTESILVNRPGKVPGSAGTDLGEATSGTLSFSFNTTHVRGEASGGTWTLQVIDAATGNTGTLTNWKLDLYGATADSNDVYVYTNEFATTAGRTTLTDTNGGNSDIVNASAVTGNSTINLNNGSTSTIAGKNLTLNGDIESAYGGDGNDTLTGNAGTNVLLGGRGNDTINGGDGADRVEGGRGNDTLTGGAARDWFVFQKDAGSVDTITDFAPSEVGEKIALIGFENVTDFSQLVLTQEGANTRLSLGDGQSVLLLNLEPSQVSEQNFVFASDTASLEIYLKYAVKALAWGTPGAENQLLPNGWGDLAMYALGGNDVLGSQTTNDLIDGGDGDDTLWGDYPGASPTPGSDWLEGGAGSDVLFGGAGADRLVGGSGNDELYGQDDNDLLIGNTGADFMDGGAGNDVLVLDGDVGTVSGASFGFYGTRVGGTGADVFKVLSSGGGSNGFIASGTEFSGANMIADFDVNQVGEKIDLTAFAWITSMSDLVISNWLINGNQLARISASNGTAAVNLNLRGVNSSQLNASHFVFAPAAPGAVNGTAGDDTLTGDAGANTINGLAGADSMTGRTGDDTYVVDNTGDTINELPGGGYDSVQSSVSYTLSNNVEALTLSGTTNLSATGNAQRNRLVGNAGNNRLDGGAEADSLIGGLGNDVYVVDDQLDTAYENAGEGTDTVESGVSWTLGNNFENLTLTGTGNINATGNDLANVLAGNAGNNVLDGAQGADDMAGGAGNDTYYVDNAGDAITEGLGDGIDTVYTSVNLALGNNVENAVLFGAATTLTGNGLDNSLIGNSLANTLSGGGGDDVLDGGAGADAMAGGTGDDAYFVDNAGDTVAENLAEGIDTVIASLNYTLGANTENLVLTGSSNLSGTGNALDNQISGNSGNNVLNGGAGNDVLDGGTGADAMAGGTGDDTYYIDVAGDTVTENAGEGTDTVVSALSYSLGANFENLTLSGFGNTNATGNSLANALRGNSGSNILDGGAGADSLRGNAGSDVLRGGIGNDNYLFAMGDGQDTIEENDGTAGNADTLSFGPGITSAAVTVSRSGQDLVLGYGAGDSVTVKSWFAGNAQKIEQVSFADGNSWNVSQLTALANLAPTVSSAIAGQAVNEDAPWSFTVPANTFADADAVIGDTLGYSASLANGSALPSWLSFDAQTRTFAGTPSNANVGSLNLRVTATDTSGAAVSSVFTVAIANTNDAPAVVNALGNQSTAEDAVWSYVIPAGTFADVDAGDMLSYSATLGNGDPLPSWLSFDTGTRTFSGTPLNGNVGVLGLRVTATDAAGAHVSSDFNVTVTNTNDAPTMLTGIGSQGATEDTAWSFMVPLNTFVDVDAGDSMSFSASLASGAALPDWLTFDAATRTFSGTPLNGDVGVLSLKVTATDSVGATVSGSFNVTIANTNDAPVIVSTPGNQSADEDSTWSFTIPANAFTDVDVGDSLVFTGTRADGGSLPSWLSFNASTRTFSGTPLNADVGLVALRVTATDTAGSTVSSTFNVTVANTNDAPVVSAPLSDQTASHATPWSYAVPIGTFQDADIADTLTLSATLGDGSALPVWLSFNPVTGILSGTPPIAYSANLVLRVTATDTFGAAASTSFNLSVAAGGNHEPVVSLVPMDQEAVETQAFTYTLPAGTFTDADPGDTLSLSAKQSNGDPLPVWLSFDASTRTFSGSPPDTAAGLLALQVVAEDAAGATATVSFSLDIANVINGTANPETLTGTNGRDYLYGFGGNDTLIGGAGADTMAGGLGNDIYVIDLLDSVVENANEGTDTVQVAATYALGANFENLTLTGSADINGTGNGMNNVLIGNIGANVLNGGAGADTMMGGSGNDIYIVDNAGDVVIETSTSPTEIDTVQSSVSFTLGANVENLILSGTNPANYVTACGNELNNTIIGDANGNNLDGGFGADTLIGGDGGDSYRVDNIGDIVIETATGGFDYLYSTVSYTLPDNVEQMYLYGVGALYGTGNSGNNYISGDTFINIMAGGLGNDFYAVRNVGDVVIENENEGTDGITVWVSYTLPENVEILYLIHENSYNGIGPDQVIDGTGNSIANTLYGNASDNYLRGMAGNDQLWGDLGNDTLDGGSGNDTMFGGGGNDRYVVDSVADVATEYANEGTDRVDSLVTYTLGANMEALTLSGSAANGTGNALANLVQGNAFSNTLNGADGFDALEGVDGDDILSDTSGANYYSGGAGADTLFGGIAADFLMGGSGNDTISTGNGQDVIAFNIGDGQDLVNPSVGIDDTVSLGGAGLSYADLTLQKNGNDLILNVSANDKLTFSNWYSGSANKNVLNLQLIAEAMAAFDAGSNDSLLNKKIQRFDFQGLVGAFDTALAASPGLTSWALTNGLTQFHLAGSDSEALGGDLAYYYGRDSSLAGVGFNKAQDVVTSAQFGTQAQTLHALGSLQDGVLRLG